MAIYQDLNPHVEYKLDHSPVTQADLVSHRSSETGLARLEPHWPVLSEESVEVPFDERKSWRHFWMIDPLDGTKEFLRRTGEFTVNIALIEDGQPVLGVVYAPVIDKLYFAARGAGSYRTDGKATTPSKLRHQRPEVRASWLAAAMLRSRKLRLTSKTKQKATKPRSWAAR